MQRMQDRNQEAENSENSNPNTLVMPLPEKTRFGDTTIFLLLDCLLCHFRSAAADKCSPAEGHWSTSTRQRLWKTCPGQPLQCRGTRCVHKVLVRTVTARLPQSSEAMMRSVMVPLSSVWLFKHSLFVCITLQVMQL